MSQSPRVFSLKWKLCLAFIAVGLSLVLIYVVMAKKVFESDKISYVFEAQNSRLESSKRQIESQIEQILFGAQSLLSTVGSDKKESRSARALFERDANLLAIELRDETNGSSIYKIEKISGQLTAFNPSVENAALGESKLVFGNDGSLLISLKMQGNADRFLRVRVLVEAKNLLPRRNVRDPVLLVQNQKIVAEVGTTSFKKEILDSLVQQSSSWIGETTKLWKYSEEGLLVSSVPLAIGGLKLLALTPEQEALGALQSLFYRSIVFLIFSTFGLIAISLFLARSMTFNLQALTKAAVDIGRGKFLNLLVVNSKDEIGVLSRAFLKMSDEIKRLLKETEDKARMDAELKTAKLVQESLLPPSTVFAFNQIEVHGILRTSTECGGDWWHYFTQGNDLYIAIADATGHGTPAALITAAARSVFSRLEQEQLSLPEMMRAWDRAVSSCSQKKVFMTGMLFKIDTLTGHGIYLGAGHESPFVFDWKEELFENTTLNLEMHPMLGDGLQDVSLKPQEFRLDLNSSLLLYTDGLFAVQSTGGKTLSEKRFGRSVAKQLTTAMNAADVTAVALSVFEEHRQKQDLPDDLTLVSIRRVLDRQPERGVQ